MLQQITILPCPREKKNQIVLVKQSSTRRLLLNLYLSIKIFVACTYALFSNFSQTGSRFCSNVIHDGPVKIH